MNSQVDIFTEECPDTFAFVPNLGHITIGDFAPAMDAIQFGKSIFADTGALQTAIHDDQQDNTLFSGDTIGNQQSNIAKLLAQQSDFHFV